MKYSVTWILDFSEQEIGSQVYKLFDKSWLKYNQISEIEGDNFQEKFNNFFDNKIYLKDNSICKLDRFWTPNENISTDIFNFIIISGNNNLLESSLFAFKLKNNKQFLTELGFPLRTTSKTYLINFNEHSWLDKDKSNNVNSIFELTLFQNSIKNSRPFDNVFIYKNTNEGLSNFGSYWKNEDNSYHQSRCLHLISFISSIDIKSKINEYPALWARTFGGLYFYNDVSEIYKLQSTEATQLLTKHLENEDKDKWSTDLKDEKLEDFVKDFDKKAVFNNIKPKINSNSIFENLNTSDAWDFFSLNKIKSFFEDTLKNIIKNVKYSKKEFITNAYSDTIKEIDNNSALLNLKISNSEIKSPQIIFEELFTNKPFSIASLISSLDVYIDKIKSKRDDFYDYYKTGYKYIDDQKNETLFIPFELNSFQLENLYILDDRFKDKDDKFLNDEEFRLLENLQDNSKKIPHPISLFIKTFFISTLIVMLLFNFLFNFINGEIYSVYLLYLFLTVLFISPFIYKWREYNKKISRLNSLKIEHELVLKYMLIKRINQYIYLKVDNFYESYILLCEKYKDQVQEFYKQSLNIKSENIIAFSSYAVKPTSEVIKDLPVTKITIDNEGTSIIASDLKNSIQNIYNLYDFIVTKNNIKLSDLIKEGKNIIYDKILSNISTTDGNYNNVADILFMNNINIKENKFKDLLDVIPPFNGILHDQNLEIIVSHSSNDNNTKNNLRNFITPLSIANYNDESIPGGLTKDLNILTINTPFHGFKTIFSHNINESFYEITKDYYNQNKDGLLKILNEVYDNVIDYIANNSTDKYVSNDLKEKSYQFIFKGFDGKFEVDFINPKLDFSVEFREFNYKIIDDKISTKIKSTSK